MTTIFSVVDASILRSQSDQAGPPPAQDFARELAKHPTQPKPSAQGDAKTATEKGFDREQMLQPASAEPASSMDETLPQMQLPAVVAQIAHAEQYAAIASSSVTETLLEARVFGWHAMAQAYLSELSTADQHYPSRDAGHVDQTSTAAQTEPVSDMPEPSEIAAAPIAIEEPGATAQLDVQLKTQPSITLDDAAMIHATEPAVTDASVSGFWPERSLRFTRQRDGSRVAWLRDFRLGDAEASHLIRFVLSDARQKGVVLSRIMLNGREVWTSPNIS